MYNVGSFSVKKTINVIQTMGHK